MTPAEHRAEAERLLGVLSTADVLTAAQVDGITTRAQVHATLALAPTPPLPTHPQHKWSLDKAHDFPDATGSALTVMPTADRSGVILSENRGVLAVLLENPDVLRTLASLLTAHADRLESKP